MAIYIGYIEKKNDFFNYAPVAEIRNGAICSLSYEEQAYLLPESPRRNICLSYSMGNREQRQEMNALFPDRCLMIFEFELSDLEDNMSYGTRNPTGYRVPVFEVLKSKKLRKLESEGLFQVIDNNLLQGNFSSDNIVDIQSEHIPQGEKVYIDINGFLAGPYEVGFRDLTSSYYVRPQLKENKYVLRGYNSSHIPVYKLSDPDTKHWSTESVRWNIISTNKIQEETLDQATDKTLMESFKDSLKASDVLDGDSVKVDSLPSLLEAYENSLLFGSTIPKDIVESRKKRLNQMFTSESDFTGSLDNIGSVIFDFLSKNKSNKQVQDWTESIIEDRPEIIDLIKDSKTIASRIDEMHQTIADLEIKRNEIENEIQNKQRTASEIDEAAVEAKKKELLEKEAEYISLSRKLEDAKSALNLTGEIKELSNKVDDLKSDERYLEKHVNGLKQDTDKYEAKFLTMLANSQDKMADIAFDGFISNKMIKAASEWEEKLEHENHNKLVEYMNSVKSLHRTPEEVANYICSEIQTVRPSYSRNVILNIAICMTQGFLTVLAGPPGCGKTSICKIMSEVLGLVRTPKDLPEGISLDATSRFINVSVERGWTSKRDFVGYYNPLSKTFDKSNRKIFDALHILDTESKEGIAKLPFVILLDEANLSPMEYYWSDFMNICDDLDTQSTVNLGEDYIFRIPETLHFLATINNDHTTETLSPRLIDRSWIITLPYVNSSAVSASKYSPTRVIEPISWVELKDTFIPKTSEYALSNEISKVYEQIHVLFRKANILISPRTDIAIKKYWATASKVFVEDETKTEPSIVALDYAVCQKLLPKIEGSGEQYEKWLEELRSLCSQEGLNLAAKRVKDIIEHGNNQMKYYQFF